MMSDDCIVLIGILLFNFQTYLLTNNLYNTISYLSIAIIALSLFSVFTGYCIGRRWEGYRKKVTAEELGERGLTGHPMGEPKTTIKTEAPTPVAKEETAK